ncbi:unnamed protein product [Camellia sinensis]
MHVDRYVPMPVLSEKEAWALFKKTVGNSVYSPELHDIASLVCKECGGLPIIILTVGAALKYKEKHVWKSALDQLKKNIAGINPNVCASLKLSYNWLESRDVKSCFLLCCFFPEDDEISIEVLARHCIARSLLGQDTNSLREASHRVLTAVNHLKDACLLLEGKDENFVKMHNAIRKVWCQKVAKEDTCNSCSAISLRFDNTLELPDDLVCPQLHTLTILLKWNINPFLKLNVPDRFFRGMKKLTILELNRICIRELTHLRLLDLGNCYKLTQIPQGVISNLSHLEELYIFDDFKPWEATRDKKERSKVDLDELGKLTQLTTLEIHIPNVILLPKDFYFETLIRFKISMGKEYVFHGKPCKFGGVSLKIEGLQEGSLAERFGLNPLGFFNNLIVLTIQDCKSKYLFSLSCARGILRLQKLQIIGCKMMEAIVGIEEEKDEDELSSQVIHFSQLEYLCLENLPKLISFYPKVEKMTSEGNSSNQAQFLLNEKEDGSKVIILHFQVGKGNAEVVLSLVGYDQELKSVMECVAFNREIGTPSVTLDGDIFQPSGLLTGGSRKCAETYDILPDGFKLKKEDGVYYMSYAMGRGCLTFGEMMQKISDLKDGSTMNMEMECVIEFPHMHMDRRPRRSRLGWDVAPQALRSAVCCCLPSIIAILYAVADQEGATKEDIERLSKYKFRRVGDFEKQNEEILESFRGIITECDTDSPIEHILSPENA